MESPFLSQSLWGPPDAGVAEGVVGYASHTALIFVRHEFRRSELGSGLARLGYQVLVAQSTGAFLDLFTSVSNVTSVFADDADAISAMTSFQQRSGRSTPRYFVASTESEDELAVAELSGATMILTY